MWLEDVADALESAGVGTVGQDIFLSLMPSSPDRCMALMEYGGSAPVQTMRAAPVVQRPRLQVMVRAGRDDYPVARDWAVEAWGVLSGLVDAGFESSSVLAVLPVGSVESIGRDEKDRPVVVCSFEVVVGPVPVVPVGPVVTVTGADSDTVTSIGGTDYRVVTWLSSGSIEVDDSLDVEYLVVGGGGGGGNQQNFLSAGGGGGGAGGLRTNVGGSPLTITGAHTITVGAGGAGSALHATPGSDGAASSIGSLVTTVGGGGGFGGSIPGGAGRDGGSGGGGGYQGGVGGSGTAGQGNAGGDGAPSPNNAAGGGGGAGAGGSDGVGGVPTVVVNGQAGDGGAGIVNVITGTSITYAGGGGGGGAATTTAGVTTLPGAGGSGGGGVGGTRSGANAGNGTDGLGGGGGGGAANSGTASPGGDGGNGIVILRWVV